MSSNDSFQNQNPLQQHTAKIIRGAVFRLVLIIAMPILLGIFIPKIAGYFDYTLPRHTMAVVIIASIVLGIALLVHFLVSQYMLLKTSFQNLEQNLAASVPQEAVEYTVLPQNYPVNGQGYMPPNGQYGNQNYMPPNGQYANQGYAPSNGQYANQGYAPSNAQYVNQGYTPSAAGYANAAPSAQSAPAPKKRGCFGKIAAFLLALLFFGTVELVVGGLVGADYYCAMKYSETTAVARNVEKGTYTSYDDEDEPQTNEKYSFDMTYTYNGKEYSVPKQHSYYTSEGESIKVYVDPNDPTVCVERLDDDTKRTLTIAAVVIAVIWLFVVIAIFKKK